jgi:hypothetical protein
MFSEDQKQFIADIVEQTAVGLFTTEEMLAKLLAIAKQADPTAEFRTNADVFGTSDDEAAFAQAEAIMNSTSTMATRG